MSRVFGAPGRYLQGAGAFHSLGTLSSRFGQRPGVVIDATVADLFRDGLVRAFAGRPDPVIFAFDSQVTRAAILEASRALAGCDVVVAIGGGKAIDAGKGVATSLGVPVITAPTIASNDSPTSSAIAIYDDDHQLIAVDMMATSPAAVVVDTQIIAGAPIRFLRAGIGDAIAKKFEAEGCRAGRGVTMFGTRPLAIGLAIADGCYRQIRRSAAAGLQSAASGKVCGALEDLVEAIILLSGLGFENGGLSVAHAMTRGLMRARGACGAMHGEHVAYGLRVHLALLPAAQVAAELDAFYREIGLPRRLADLGLHGAEPAELRAIAEAAMTAPHIVNFPVTVDAGAIAVAMARLEAQGD